MQESRAIAEKPRDAVVNFDIYSLSLDILFRLNVAVLHLE